MLWEWYKCMRIKSETHSACSPLILVDDDYNDDDERRLEEKSVPLASTLAVCYCN